MCINIYAHLIIIEILDEIYTRTQLIYGTVYLTGRELAHQARAAVARGIS